MTGPWARAQLRRPATRASAVAAVALGAWTAWSPGTRFGLSGALGGWTFAGRHLLDAGLVVVAIAGALAGAGTRQRRIDEQLHAAGLTPSAAASLVAASAAVVGLVLAGCFAIGTAMGGEVRALGRGGSWWADAGLAPAPWVAMGSVARLGLAAALVAALAALVGGAIGREDVAAAVIVASTALHLAPAAALLARVPGAADAVAFTPWGAIRAVALGDRGLAAAGFERPTSVVPFAAVGVGWIVAIVLVALPPGRGRVHRPRLMRPGGSSGPPGSSGATAGVARVVGATAALALTITAGALVPARVAASLPWRWQRPWREAVHDGWSSGQSVDRYVTAVRARTPEAAADRVVRPGAVPTAVDEAVGRASRIVRQPESSMRGPEVVVVELDFDEPVRSGSSTFHRYLTRFVLQPDDDGRWRIAGAEGPVAADGDPP